MKINSYKFKPIYGIYIYKHRVIILWKYASTSDTYIIIIGLAHLEGN